MVITDGINVRMCIRLTEYHHRQTDRQTDVEKCHISIARKYVDAR